MSEIERDYGSGIVSNVRVNVRVNVRDNKHCNPKSRVYIIFDTYVQYTNSLTFMDIVEI